VAATADKKNVIGYPAVADRIDRASLATDVAPGNYGIAVARWSFEALRPMEQLWYGVEPHPSTGEALSDDDAERFVTSVAESGEDWASASAEIDMLRLSHGLEQGLLVRARDRFEEYTSQLQAQNEDRADARVRSIKTHLKQQKAKYQEVQRRHLERGNPGLAKAQDTNIGRLEARIERQLLAIEEKRKLHQSIEEICVGVVRVV